MKSSRSSLFLAAALVACLSASSYAQASPTDDVRISAASDYRDGMPVVVYSRDMVAPAAVADLVASADEQKPHVALQAASQYELTRGRQRPQLTPGWRLVPGA